MSLTRVNRDKGAPSCLVPRVCPRPTSSVVATGMGLGQLVQHRGDHYGIRHVRVVAGFLAGQVDDRTVGNGDEFLREVPGVPPVGIVRPAISAQW